MYGISYLGSPSLSNYYGTTNLSNAMYGNIGQRAYSTYSLPSMYSYMNSYYTTPKTYTVPYVTPTNSNGEANNPSSTNTTSYNRDTGYTSHQDQATNSAISRGVMSDISSMANKGLQTGIAALSTGAGISGAVSAGMGAGLSGVTGMMGNAIANSLGIQANPMATAALSTIGSLAFGPVGGVVGSIAAPVAADLTGDLLGFRSNEDLRDMFEDIDTLDFAAGRRAGAYASANKDISDSLRDYSREEDTDYEKSFALESSVAYSSALDAGLTPEQAAQVASAQTGWDYSSAELEAIATTNPDAFNAQRAFSQAAYDISTEDPDKDIADVAKEALSNMHSSPSVSLAMAETVLGYNSNIASRSAIDTAFNPDALSVEAVQAVQDIEAIAAEEATNGYNSGNDGREVGDSAGMFGEVSNVNADGSYTVSGTHPTGGAYSFDVSAENPNNPNTNGIPDGGRDSSSDGYDGPSSDDGDRDNGEGNTSGFGR